MRIACLLAIILGAVPIAGAQAQDAGPADPSDQSMFAVLLSSQVYRTFIDEEFNAKEPAASKAQCPILKGLDYTKAVPLRPVKFSGPRNGLNITAGAWIAYIVFDRCGTRVIRRAILEVQPGRGIESIPLLPGDFSGDLRLEQDARRIVSPGLLAKAGCADSKSLAILDVQAKPSDDPDKIRHETWVANACGKGVDIDVTYVRDATGVTISTAAITPPR